MLQLRFRARRLMGQLARVAALCGCAAGGGGSTPPFVERLDACLPRGLGLVAHIYGAAKASEGHLDAPLMFLFLKAVTDPFLSFVREWVWEGTMIDQFAEFGLQCRPAVSVFPPFSLVLLFFVPVLNLAFSFCVTSRRSRSGQARIGQRAM